MIERQPFKPAPVFSFIEDRFKCRDRTLELIWFVKCENASMDTGDKETGLKRGDPVTKIDGYAFPGVVVSSFLTLRGLRRVVVEATGADYRGMLHIFNPDQLRKNDP